MGNQGQMVRKYMAMRLKQWENEPNDARVKGELAQLRHGIGKSILWIPDITNFTRLTTYWNFLMRKRS